MIAQLSSRALVTFSGDDTADFLNDLITADVKTLSPSSPSVLRQAVLLTPQGRVLFDLLVSRNTDSYTLELDASRRGDFIKKMSMYRMRRDISITPDDRNVYALTANNIAANSITDSRFAANVARYYGHRQDADANDAAWQALRYAEGVAEGAGDLPPEKALPLEARLDLNDGINFEKGCYIGQEVTARTRYRGLLKRVYLPVRFAPTLSLGQITTPCDIKWGDKNAGQLLGIAAASDGLIGLASIRLEALDTETPITAETHTITPFYPPRLMPLPSKT